MFKSGESHRAAMEALRRRIEEEGFERVMASFEAEDARRKANARFLHRATLFLAVGIGSFAASNIIMRLAEDLRRARR